MRYLVMDIHREEAVVLDEDGRFLHVKNSDYRIGDTINTVRIIDSPRKTMRSIGRIGAIAACLAAVLFFTLYLSLFRPVSSIKVSALSDVTLRMNAQGQVISMDASDARGKCLVESCKFRWKPHLEVLEELLDRAMEMGYLTKRGTLTLVVKGEDDDETAEWTKSLFQAVRAKFVGRPGVHLVLNDIKECIGEWDDDDHDDDDGDGDDIHDHDGDGDDKNNDEDSNDRGNRRYAPNRKKGKNQAVPQGNGIDDASEDSAAYPGFSGGSDRPGDADESDDAENLGDPDSSDEPEEPNDPDDPDEPDEPDDAE